MYKNKKVAVVIPALNEAEALPLVIRDIPIFADRIIVADNGSTDGTGAAALAADRYGRVAVVREERRGYGSACLAALRKLVDEEIIVFLDGDHSDDPSGMDKLLEPIMEHNAEVVISNRFTAGLKPGAMSPQQRFGNKLAVLLIRLLWGYRYYDLGPFRAVTRAALDRLNLRDPDFGWTIELQLKALRQKMRIAQVDVPYVCRRRGTSKVSGTICGTLGAGFKIIGYILRHKILPL